MKPEVEISIHDKYQIEIKIVCPINRESRVNDYYVDAFFFLPRNLAVNPQTYTGKEFYNDFSEYIRFKTPSVNLHELAKPENKILASLAASIDNLPENAENYTRHLKMFCSISRSAMRDNAVRIQEMSGDGAGRNAVAEYLGNIQSLLKNYRTLRDRLTGFPERLELFDLVDEFLSITSNAYVYRIWNTLSGDSSLADELRSLAGQGLAEIEYRRMRGCPSVPDVNKDNSEILYRESTLKKAMGNILFLKVDTGRDGVWIENLLLSLSAAVAMIFVTGIAFLWRGFFRYAEFSMSFFVIWVIAYMFKDRIKALLQQFCMNKRSAYSYDYRQKIYDGLGNEVGICREGFRHCDGRDLNETLTKVRNRTTLSRLEDGSLNENVIVYRKKIELFGDGCKNIFREFNVTGVVNIYRINILHWLYKMDNPRRTIYFSDGNEVLPMKAHRDYHVNIVLRYGERGGEEQYIRRRLVLCRDGIRRLDKFDS